MPTGANKIQTFIGDNQTCGTKIQKKIHPRVTGNRGKQTRNFRNKFCKSIHPPGSAQSNIRKFTILTKCQKLIKRETKKELQKVVQKQQYHLQNQDVQTIIKGSLHVQYKKFNFTKHESSMMGTKEVQPYPAGKFNAGVRRKCNLIEQESSMLGKKCFQSRVCTSTKKIHQ